MKGGGFTAEAPGRREKPKGDGRGYFRFARGKGYLAPQYPAGLNCCSSAVFRVNTGMKVSTRFRPFLLAT